MQLIDWPTVLLADQIEYNWMSVKIFSHRIKLEGGPFGEKNYRKKLEGGTFGEKNYRKSLTMPKKLKEDPLRIFNIHRAKHQKIEGGILGEKDSEKKSHKVEKKLKGGPFSLSRYCMLRGKRGKTFLVQFARTNNSNWFLREKREKNFVELLRTILVSSCGLKKSHYNSRVSLHEAPTNNRNRSIGRPLS